MNKQAISRSFNFWILYQVDSYFTPPRDFWRTTQHKDTIMLTALHKQITNVHIVLPLSLSYSSSSSSSPTSGQFWRIYCKYGIWDQRSAVQWGKIYQPVDIIAERGREREGESRFAQKISDSAKISNISWDTAAWIIFLEIHRLHNFIVTSKKY